jgi:hypothetical protein
VDAQTLVSYHFGPFRVDVVKRELYKEGRPRRVSTQVFNCLVYLLERPGQAIGKEDLIQTFWPGEVGDLNIRLKNLFARLYSTLDDTDRKKRKYILRRQNFVTFIAPVRHTPRQQATKRIARLQSRSIAGVRQGSGARRRVVAVSVDGPFLIARDLQGIEVWRHFFERGLDPHTYDGAALAAQYWIGDLRDRGGTDVLFRYDPLIRNSAEVSAVPEESSSLLCFDESGRVVWSFTVGREVRDPSGPIHPPYHVVAMLVVSSRRSHTPRRIVIASAHKTDQACQVAFLDPDGRLVAEYWHPGVLFWLRAVNTGPGGSPRLLAAGVNNGERRATIVQLDPFAMSGVSTPWHMKEPRFRLLDMPEANEDLVILFPRTCLSLSRNEPYTRVSTFAVDQDAVHASVIESYKPTSPRVVFYDFDLSLRLKRAFVSSDYREEHLQSEASGALTHSWKEDEEALAGGLEYRTSHPKGSQSNRERGLRGCPR